VTAEVETARQQWEEGHRRFQATVADAARHERLTLQVEALTDELRRRIGQVFTLKELADEYHRAERWSREVAAAAVPAGRPGDLSIAEDAAFHIYARGARDYAP